MHKEIELIKTGHNSFKNTQTCGSDQDLEGEGKVWKQFVKMFLIALWTKCLAVLGYR